MTLTRIVSVEQWKEKPDWNSFKREYWEKLTRYSILKGVFLLEMGR